MTENQAWPLPSPELPGSGSKGRWRQSHPLSRVLPSSPAGKSTPEEAFKESLEAMGRITFIEIMFPRPRWTRTSFGSYPRTPLRRNSLKTSLGSFSTNHSRSDSALQRMSHRSYHLPLELCLGEQILVYLLRSDVLSRFFDWPPFLISSMACLCLSVCVRLPR